MREKVEQTNKSTFRKRSVWLVSCILPALAIAFGCVLLLADTIFNISFAITFLIVPTVFIAFLALVIFTVNKARPKVILMIVVLVSFAVSFSFGAMFGHFEMLAYKQNTEIGESYIEVCEAFDSMPTLDEVGAYTTAEHYDYFSTFFCIFDCNADTLIVHYDPVEYQEQKALLEEKYVFQTDEMTAFNHACQPFAEINGYAFRVLEINEEYCSERYYPKKMVLIATNDQDNSISYTAFYDHDLDYIESLEEFLLNDCGWKHIVK